MLNLISVTENDILVSAATAEGITSMSDFIMRERDYRTDPFSITTNTGCTTEIPASHRYKIIQLQNYARYVHAQHSQAPTDDEWKALTLEALQQYAFPVTVPTTATSDDALHDPLGLHELVDPSPSPDLLPYLSQHQPMGRITHRSDHALPPPKILALDHDIMTSTSVPQQKAMGSIDQSRLPDKCTSSPHALVSPSPKCSRGPRMTKAD